MSTVRTLINLAANTGWKLHQLDVKNVFLHWRAGWGMDCSLDMGRDPRGLYGGWPMLQQKCQVRGSRPGLNILPLIKECLIKEWQVRGSRSDLNILPLKLRPLSGEQVGVHGLKSGHGSGPKSLCVTGRSMFNSLYVKLMKMFHANVNRCYCPSEEVAKRAELDGLSPSQIRVFGLPIRPSFCQAIISKDDLRVELELDPHLPAVLLMGGGDGMGPVEKTAKALGESLYNESQQKPIGQLVVICGRNQTLRATLQLVHWKIPVKICGFESQMEKWMGACDCIITKAGPGTIAEALIRGLPMILNDFIPGQEVGNVPYVVGNGAGVFCKSSKDTARLVARWFGPDSAELMKMSECALKLSQPEAVFDIVKDIHELVQEQGPMSRISYTLTSSFSHGA